MLYKLKHIGLMMKEIAGAAVGALLILISGLLGDGQIDFGEGTAAVVSFLGGVLVTSFVKNATSGFWYYGKAWVQGLIAAVGSFGSAMTDGKGWPPSSAEILMIVVAFLGGMGITAATPNARRSDASTFKNDLARPGL